MNDEKWMDVNALVQNTFVKSSMKLREIIIGIVLIGLQIKAYAQEEIEFKCGRRLVNHEALIVNGYESKEGDWPWHAAIFHTANQGIFYKCGGSLISSNSVLTAVHCVFEENRQIIPERLSVQLGKHNLKNIGTHGQELDVHRIILHPNFNTSDLSNDIAIIRVSTVVTFSDYIQPICLWPSDKVAISHVTQRFGTVIGWGVTETDNLSYILRQALMPIVPPLKCLTSDRHFYGNFLSENNFCAGFRNGTSVCNGDSGGSISFEEHGVYYIRGVLSFSQSRKDKNLCNSEEYVIFTDVAKYLPWIENVVPELKRPPSVIDSLPRLKTAGGKEYVVGKGSLNWFKAYEFCRFHQMQLATIQSKEENETFLRLITGSNLDFVWTSGNDLAVEGEFIWMSNGQPVTYTAWQDDEPNDFEGTEDCILFNYTNDWNDVDCSREFAFVCETI